MPQAISQAGLTQKAYQDGELAIKNLSPIERAALVKHIGIESGRAPFLTLLKTARKLKTMANFPDEDIISSYDCHSDFPVIGNPKLFVKKTYRDLYKQIDEHFKIYPLTNRIAVTGTAGIGKSAFLVYFALKVLAESPDDCPPLLIYHQRSGDSPCYAFSGTEIVRTGNSTLFGDLLDLDETWYLVDSAPRPLLCKARTIIAVSPNTLNADTSEYQEFDKQGLPKYYMAPWSLPELKRCREQVFENLPYNVMQQFYDKVGGIPRYVLQIPAKEYAGRKVTSTDATMKKNIKKRKKLPPK